MSVHFVGNRTNGEMLEVTNGQFQLNDEVLYEALKRYFLAPFKGESFYCFSDKESAVAKAVSQIFDKPASFHAKSKELAQYLYQCGTTKKIASGELYVTYLKDCIIDDEIVDAIGIFKSERKDTFIKAKARNKEEGAEMFTDEGFNIHKLDKGCIIFNINQEEGYRVAMIDTNSNIATALYWKTDFLGVEPVDTEYFMTNQYMSMVKGFSKDYLGIENEIPREDQLSFLQKAKEYFESNEEFKTDKFTKEVIVEPELAETFTSYKEEYEQDYQLPAMETFKISQPAVEKNASKNFRSVIKLDRNFQITVDGNSQHLERGYDEKKKMHYYKLYYNNEA